MKIVYDPRMDKTKASQIAKIKTKCPVCGETQSTFEHIMADVLAGVDTEAGPPFKYWQTGIDKVDSRYERHGFLWLKQYKIDIYQCFTCGARWESDPVLYKRSDWIDSVFMPDN